MRLRRFLAAHTLGSIAFAGITLWVGSVAQSRWPWLKDWIADVYGPWALRIGLGLVVLLAILFALGRRLEQRQDEAQPSSTSAPSHGPSSSEPATD